MHPRGDIGRVPRSVRCCGQLAKATTPQPAFRVGNHRLAVAERWRRSAAVGARPEWRGIGRARPGPHRAVWVWTRRPGERHRLRHAGTVIRALAPPRLRQKPYARHDFVADAQRVEFAALFGQRCTATGRRNAAGQRRGRRRRRRQEVCARFVRGQRTVSIVAPGRALRPQVVRHDRTAQAHRASLQEPLAADGD